MQAKLGAFQAKPAFSSLSPKWRLHLVSLFELLNWRNLSHLPCARFVYLPHGVFGLHFGYGLGLCECVHGFGIFNTNTRSSLRHKWQALAIENFRTKSPTMSTQKFSCVVYIQRHFHVYTNF